MSNCDLPDLSRLQLHVGVGPTETELRRELVRDRKVKKEIQMLENSDFVNNDESRKQRRAAAQKNHEANRSLLNPQHISAIQFVRSMFAKGYVKMALYENIPPGWLVVEPVGLGRPISERLAQEDRRRYFDLPIWFPDGIFSYTPFRGALLQVGFDVFVNFEGYKDRRWWAIEVPLAKSLDIFVNTWIYDQPFIDEDWARGGEGPYLENQVYTDGDTGAFEMAPSAQKAQTERNQLYVDYLQERMKQEGIIELDKHLQLPAPTAKEKGVGEIPPLVESGNPGTISSLKP